MMFKRFVSDILYKSIYCGYLFELHQQVDAIQMGTHNICLYKVDKKFVIWKLLNCLTVRLQGYVRYLG